jgi:NADH-quinone oxidoreductase subunit L
MGLLGIIQNDIKRVIAYSTLSQLGYMTVALGVSAYSAAIFHLMTHAFFKALLFLGAGSVIIAMHHKQDIWEMGGLWKKMPITWITSLLGTLALIGFPFFAGFYSKDAIIEATKASHIFGHQYAYWAVLLGVFITSFYSFRLYFVVFHGKPRMDEETLSHVHETPWVVTLPLVLLAIPSVIIGALSIDSMLFGGVLAEAIHVDHHHDVLHHLKEHFHDWKSFALHGFQTVPFYLAAAGFLTAFALYGINVNIGRSFGEKLKNMPVGKQLYALLDNKYGFDSFNQNVLSKGAVIIGHGLWQKIDATIIDGFLVNGTSKLIGAVSAIVRKLQTGLLYHYAFAMIVGLVLALSWLLIN